PLEFKPENWKPFTDLMPADTADEEAVADYSIALSILKEQAMRRQDWDNLLNVAFYQQATRDYFQSMRYGIPAQRPTFERITENIQARLPAGQHFVGLADTATQAARITITSRELTGSKLRYTGRNLRGKMHAFLDGLRVGADVGEAYLSLSRQYRSLFGIGWTDVTYFWFPGVHGMAPIRPERGDLLFQVSNPAQFVRNPILKLSTEYPPRFQVHLAGADQSDRTRGLSDADAILQQQRMLSMEKLSLGLTAADGPRHILFSLIGPEDFSGLERFLHGLDTTAVSPWFFSGNQLIRNPASEITNYNLLLAIKKKKLQG
ncbi:MAG: hypothetical protein KDK30_19020, partial [Leptospiraceae bacterium]|nr:hypothetical protein [Leptospiraceae bacterium]